MDNEIDRKIDVTAILFLLVQNRYQWYSWTLIGSDANGLGIQEWLNHLVEKTVEKVISSDPPFVVYFSTALSCKPLTDQGWRSYHYFYSLVFVDYFVVHRLITIQIEPKCRLFKIYGFFVHNNPEAEAQMSYAHALSLS